MSDPVAFSIDYLADSSKDIPNMVVQLSFLLMSGIIVMVFAFAKDLNGARKGVMTTVLIEYMFLILGSTVIYRASGDVMKFELTPFWSYVAIGEGQTEMIQGNFLNISLGVPAGFLLSFIFIHRSWWKAALVGFVLSSVIELSQLVFKRGLCEFDDVFHNTLGCVIGYGVGVMMIITINKVRK